MGWLGKAIGKIGKIAVPLAATAIGGPLLGGAAGGLAGKLGGKGAAGLAGKLLGHSDLILGGIGALQGIKDQSKAGKMRNQALGLSMDQYNQTAPLRARAIQLAQRNIASPQLGSIFSDPGNPYNRSGDLVSKLMQRGVG